MSGAPTTLNIEATDSPTIRNIEATGEGKLARLGAWGMRGMRWPRVACSTVIGLWKMGTETRTMSAFLAIEMSLNEMDE
eukprot:scaffold26167_cov67-Isochrysis_galbana.AAC.1